jgi:hypothetical protein
MEAQECAISARAKLWIFKAQGSKAWERNSEE